MPILCLDLASKLTQVFFQEISLKLVIKTNGPQKEL